MRKLLYLTFALAQLLRAGAGPRELSLRWTELESAVAGKHVRILLPNGARQLVHYIYAQLTKLTK